MCMQRENNKKKKNMVKKVFSAIDSTRRLVKIEIPQADIRYAQRFKDSSLACSTKIELNSIFSLLSSVARLFLFAHNTTSEKHNLASWASATAKIDYIKLEKFI